MSTASFTRRLFPVGAFLAMLMGWQGGAVAEGEGGGAGDKVDREGKVEKLEPPQHLLLIEPRNLRSEVFVLVPGARRTVYSAARPGKLGARHYSRDAFRAAYPGGWKEFFEKGRAAAAAHLKTLKPSYRRGSDQVIEYAILQADHPLTASVIIAPGFKSLFADTLGENLLIAIPNRHTVFVFSKLASKMPEYHAVMAGLYKDSIFPGSSEIFELTDDGIRVVGAF